MPSYSPVYSVPLILYTPDTPNTAFEVPTGFTAVVREIDITSIGADTYLTAAITADGDSDFVNFAVLNSEGVLTSTQWRGHVAVPAPYFIVIGVSSFGDEDTAYVGGYLLRNNLT